MSIQIELSSPVEEKLKSKAAQLGKSLNDLIVEILQEEVKNEVDTTSESYLLQQVNLGIPIEQWHRYHSLIEKRNAVQLTTEEQQELIHLSDTIEERNAERMSYIFELAAKRQVAPESIIQELGLQ
ncbi:MAG: hypothetical protein AAGI23_18630 [Bacteroidota bacterium]